MKEWLTAALLNTRMPSERMLPSEENKISPARKSLGRIKVKPFSGSVLLRTLCRRSAVLPLSLRRMCHSVAQAQSRSAVINRRARYIFRLP